MSGKKSNDDIDGWFFVIKIKEILVEGVGLDKRGDGYKMGVGWVF